MHYFAIAKPIWHSMEGGCFHSEKGMCKQRSNIEQIQLSAGLSPHRHTHKYFKKHFWTFEANESEYFC